MGTILVPGDILVPVAGVLLALVGWHAWRTGVAARDMMLRLALVAWAAALAALAFFPLPLPPYDATESPFDYRGWPYPWVGFLPFDTIRSSLDQGWNYPAGKFLVGNIGAFVPLGFLAPMLSARWRSATRTLLLGLAVSMAIETAQLGLSVAMGFPWRIADVDDLLLNTLGTLVGFVGWAVLSAAVGSRHAR